MLNCLLYTYDKDYDNKNQVMQERVYSIFNFQVNVHNWANSGQVHQHGRNLERRIKAKSMEDWCMLYFFPWPAQSDFLQNSGSPSHSDLFQFYDNHEARKCPTCLFTGQSCGTIFSIESHFSKMNLSFLKLL